MIVIMKKNNILLIGMIFILAIALYTLNPGRGRVSPVNSGNTQKTILLDAGHGGEDPGAVSDYSGTSEKDINLNIVLEIKRLLEAENYKVMLTREEDRLEYQEDTTNIVQKRKQDLLRRKKMMDEAGADIVVSIHLNKFPQTKYYGAQTFFPPKMQQSQKLAMSIQKSIRENLDPSNKREALVKKEPIIILKDCKTTTVVVECGFLSNPEEEKKLQNKEYQDKTAFAVKEGIKAYFAKN
ncbi:N-acetylmuramoyl-L-alanine amidase [Pseudobacteroides cellulosolvens]|uniref:Cell wall hydrolase/autolysin n=1 Tax=Pseudobacteroides cellulosolvens ATCC 35603 = DSM 2933 TaxID=398512 RepID=A0A0L6JNX9_9FIRM|nr:N-acetylmuramoyl-L-alanine amidase [Pseudobacteroides cellulosolvens]KNY27483.1 cell wall hydrolase/autolysin [Pseudobacteroides cellulosolvens ATCC 35603 = DSM 2933]